MFSEFSEFSDLLGSLDKSPSVVRYTLENFPRRISHAQNDKKTLEN